MMGKTHKYFNLLLVLIAIKLGFSLSGESAVVLVAAYLFSTYVITPDLDLWFPVVKHRGVTHRLSGILFSGLLVFLASVAVLGEVSILGIIAGAGFSLGWAGHRVGDELSNEFGGVKHDWLVKFLVVVAFVWIGLDLLGLLPDVDVDELYSNIVGNLTTR